MAELKLNPQQQRFFIAVLEGKPASEAFKAARFPTGGSNLSKGAITKGASRMMNNAAMQAALARARGNLVAKAGITVDTIVERLAHVYDVALACNPPQTSGAVAAQLGIAKLLGLVVDRSQVVVQHKPAISSKQVELSESEWREQFAPAVTTTVTKPKDK